MVDKYIAHGMGMKATKNPRAIYFKYKYKQ